METCAFKELGGGCAGQEAYSSETPPPARSFLGRGGAARLWASPLSDRLVFVPHSVGGVRVRGRPSWPDLWSSSLAVPLQKLKFVDLEGVAGAGANNTLPIRRCALQFTQLSPSVLLN